MAFLTIKTAEGERYRFEVTRSPLAIGRSSTNDLVLGERAVSRYHAEITSHDGEYEILEIGRTKNGVHVNGRRIGGPTLLRNGDRIRIGSNTLIFGSGEPRVEFTNEPLTPGPETTVLPVGNLSSPGLHDTARLSGESPATGTLEALKSGAEGAGAGEAAAEATDRALSVVLDLVLEADRQLVFQPPGVAIFESIMDLARQAVPFERGVLMLLNESGKLVEQTERIPPEERDRTIAVSRRIVESVVHKQEAVMTSDALSDIRFRKAESVGELGIRSVICVPLWNNREVIGLIYVDSRKQADVFTQYHLHLLTHLAIIAAVKIEHRRLFEQVIEGDRLLRDLRRAAAIQEGLLPAAAPTVPGYVLDGRTIACQSVAGDCFDYLLQGEGCVGLCVADVAGHGLDAALLTSFFLASLRAMCGLKIPPDEMMERLNRALCPHFPASRFVTAFFGVLDPVKHSLTYVNAGQTPPLILRGAGAVQRLAPTGLFLGSFESVTYRAETVSLGRGDVFIGYSDGVVEAVDASGEMFGEQRLIELVSGIRQSPPGDILDAIFDAAEGHCDQPPEDDWTLLVLRREA